MKLEELKNKIYQGDCLEVMKDIPDNSVDLVLTDIPYDGVNRESQGLRNLDKGDADIITFDLDEFLKETDRVCKGSGYIFCGWGQISKIIDYFGKYSTRLCVWEKTNPSPMNGDFIWLSGVEFAVYFKKPNATFNEHCKSPVWKFQSGRNKEHPTEKPLKLFEYLVSVSSKENDLVLDACIGSGTTAKASKNLNRNFIGIEVSEKYCEIAEQRLRQEVLL